MCLTGWTARPRRRCNGCPQCTNRLALTCSSRPATNGSPGAFEQSPAHKPAVLPRSSGTSATRRRLSVNAASIETTTINVRCGLVGCSGRVGRPKNHIATSGPQLHRQVYDPRRYFRAHLDHVHDIRREITISRVCEHGVRSLFQLGNDERQIIRLRLARLQ
jgi:hypothetical protein